MKIGSTAHITHACRAGHGGILFLFSIPEGLLFLALFKETEGPGKVMQLYKQGRHHVKLF